MAVPSVVKFKKDGVTYESAIERTQYTLRELTRAALRDTGKYVCRQFRQAYYGAFRRRRGRIGRYTQYWVRSRAGDLQVGLKPNGFYGGFQEVGSSKQARMGLLRAAVDDNIAEIVKIQSQYLSALEEEAQALSLIDEKEMEGSADD